MNYKLPTRTCNLFAKKCYSKLKKIEKMSNLKSLEDDLRAEMSKNAAVRIKRGLSRARPNSGVSVARSLETKPAKKALFLTSPSQDRTRFPLPVTAGREVTSLTGLPPTVSMVGYTAGVSVVLREFRACVNIGKNFSHLHRTYVVQQMGKKYPKVI